jgi:PAS domain S-box-containing protein
MNGTELQELLAKYEAIIQAFDGLIYICSDAYEVEFMNERFLERTGYNPLGEKCYKALHNSDHICPWCVNERVFKGETVRWEVMSPKDKHWYYVVNTPIRHGDGHVSKMAMLQDITERKRTEEAIKERERFLSNIFTSIQDGISILDSDLNIVRVNPVMEQWYAHKAPLEGRKCYDAYHGKREPCSLCPSLRTITTGKAAHEVVPRVGPCGENTGWLDLFSFPLLDVETGQMKGIIEYVRDITDRKRAEDEVTILNEQLKNRTAALETVNKDLEAFGYMVSHDLRAPLVAIGGFTRKLAEKYSQSIDGKARRMLNIIGKNVKEMEELIDDVLTFSRLGYAAISAAKVNIVELVASLAEEYRHLLVSRNVHFIVRDLPPAHCDKSMIRQVFVNLLSNAFKYTQSRELPLIEVAARAGAEENIYWVKDNGIGFSETDKERIFDVFQRALSGEAYEGTGIGLAIVRRIVERHGGKVWAEAKPDEGATFYFSLPLPRHPGATEVFLDNSTHQLL